MTRRDALIALLAQPDLPCLPTRKRRYTQPGDHVKQAKLRIELERAYIRHRYAAAGIEEASIVSLRRTRVLPFRRKSA
jgi:hypothetical protein